MWNGAIATTSVEDFQSSEIHVTLRVTPVGMISEMLAVVIFT